MSLKNISIIGLFALITMNITQVQAQTPTLWGMTPTGGQNGYGVIYNYDLNTGGYAAQYNFDTVSGILPKGSLIQANDGYLYGMTNAGGKYGSGTLFNYNTSTGGYNVLHDFGSDSDGRGPWGTLFQADNGLLYGMTYAGGKLRLGTIFSYNIYTGTYRNLHYFAGGLSDGEQPLGAIMQASNGLLYGMTSGGGGGGVIFSYNIASDIYKVIFSFRDHVTNGANPFGTLVQANDSLLLGLTKSGGAVYVGTIFKYNILNDSESIIHSFSDYLKGQEPQGSIIKANNDLFYGMVSFGGYDSVGVLFNYDLVADTVGDVHDFGLNHDGINPFGSLMQARNGLLYGTTLYGGLNDSGTIFSYNILNGEERILHSFSGNNDGYYPYADLVEVDFPTAVYEVSRPNQLKLYPNPTSGKLQIDIENRRATSLQVSITDISGKVVEREYINNADKIEMDVSSLSSGMYFVTVQTDAQKWVKKFVKQ